MFEKIEATLYLIQLLEGIKSLVVFNFEATESLLGMHWCVLSGTSTSTSSQKQ